MSAVPEPTYVQRLNERLDEAIVREAKLRERFELASEVLHAIGRLCDDAEEARRGCVSIAEIAEALELRGWR